MQSLKKTFGLMFVLTVLLSSLPAPQAHAEGFCETTGEFAKKFTDPKYAAKFGAGVFAIYVLLDFFLRKPLKEERFDVDVLKNGTVKEKMQHSWYYFMDKIIGWPYKSKKLVCKVENGKAKMEIQEEQYPAGVLGKFQGYVLVGSKSCIEFIIKELGSVALMYLILDAMADGKMTGMIKEVINKGMEAKGLPEVN